MRTYTQITDMEKPLRQLYDRAAIESCKVDAMSLKKERFMKEYVSVKPQQTTIVDAELDFGNKEQQEIVVGAKGYMQTFSFISSYDFYISFSDKDTQEYLLKVPYEEYRNISKGQTIRILYGKGLLGKKYDVYSDALYIKPYSDSWSPVADEKLTEIIDEETPVR